MYYTLFSFLLKPYINLFILMKFLFLEIYVKLEYTG